MTEPNASYSKYTEDNIKVIRRRKLLPWWIKFFIWVFLIFGIAVPVGIIFMVIGWNFQLSLYGLKTMEPRSIIGIFLLFLFASKALVAFALWTEKDYAIKLAIIDAILGCIVCFLVIAIIPFISDEDGNQFTFRLELLILIPYWIKMNRIKEKWKEINIS